MQTVYFVCAIAGGTVLVCQFVMTVLGLGGDDADFDVDFDVPDDIDLPVDGHDAHAGHGSTWLFGILSFKTIVAACAFFGIAGMAGSTGGVPVFPGFIIALASGGSAMFLVHGLMKGLMKLNHDGSLRIERSDGRRGTVYIPIPGNKSGEGKIQLRLQNRIVELKAMTGHPEKLPTGARVVISRVLTPSTVEVEMLPENKLASSDREPEDVST